jgi:hypothetical protein
MDVLACPSCSRRYAVTGAGELGGWRCTSCSSELRLSEHDAPNVDLLGHEARSPIMDYYLHPLAPGGESDNAAGGARPSHGGT